MFVIKKYKGIVVLLMKLLVKYLVCLFSDILLIILNIFYKMNVHKYFVLLK
jgi:hypothetical protein